MVLPESMWAEMPMFLNLVRSMMTSNFSQTGVSNRPGAMARASRVALTGDKTAWTVPRRQASPRDTAGCRKVTLFILRTNRLVAKVKFASICRRRAKIGPISARPNQSFRQIPGIDLSLCEN